MADTSAKPFAHLHLHSEYSLLDGANRVGKLVDYIKELGMDAVAVTDHGNLHAAVEFYGKAKDAGIKPIMGIEAYVAPDVDGKPSDRTNREYTGVSDGGFHLVLLAENNAGWQNLLKLSSDAYVNGFYFKPRMDKTTLEQWSDGLIAINGHLGSSIAFHLNRFKKTGDKKHYKTAVAEAKWHKKIFGKNEKGEPRFYMELQRHETPDQHAINPDIIEIARELDIPLVCDNDAHFMTKDDWDPHDTLCCISMGKIKNDPNRLHYPRDLYVRSAEEMWELFGEDVPDALENTAKIAERCNVDLDFDANHAPVVKPVIGERIRSIAKKLDTLDAAKIAKGFESEFELGSNEWIKDFCAQVEVEPVNDENGDADRAALEKDCDLALRLLSEAGLVWRYGVDGISDEIRARLERELKVLSDKLISAYFIIVWDFVNYGRQNAIPCNARGSGVGTMTGYVLGLSNACPVEYGLLFERFTDPDRSEYPDIDIDMCQDGRQGLIEFVRQKYGHVAQIITFGTLKARAAVRDVGRVHDVSLAEVDKVCKLIGDGLKTTIKSALESEPDLQKLYQDQPAIRDMLDTGIRLEGMARHAGVHAAGVIVATQPLDNIVPLYKPPANDTQIVTQWDGPTCEKVGLLKMDFLGLRTLSIIERARKLVTESLDAETIRKSVDPEGKGGPNYDPLVLERLRFDDRKVLDLFCRGETAGVFQFESGGMRNLLMAMKPDRLEDLIAANALYRPGPMELIPNYNNRKHGKEDVPKVHPIVDRLTEETYGIMVYQEQVMQVLNQLGGIPLRQAYTIIKAISKKKEKTINAARADFIDGAAKENNVDKKIAEDLFDLILKFAGYGFNKSHSTGYAIVAYQTAYLKSYFPVQYMAAVLTYESVSTEKVVEYIDECKRVRLPSGKRGIEVKPPDINLSELGFAVVFEDGEPQDADHGHIRFGLSAVKGLGVGAIEGIIAERDKSGPFLSLFDFCERVPGSTCGKSALEALIKCGAFDSLHGQPARAAMLTGLEQAMSRGAQESKLRSSDDFLFGAVAEADSQAKAESDDQPSLPDVTPWVTREELEHEKEVLGFYVSSHPLAEHEDALWRFGSTSVAGLKELPADTPVVFGGMLTRVRPTVTRAKQEKMAMLTIEDRTGPIDAVVFPRTYEVAAPLLQVDSIVFLHGKVDRRREEPSIVVEKVTPIEQAPAELTQAVKIVIHDPTPAERGTAYNGEFKRLYEVLRQAGNRNGSSAKAGVVFELHQAGKVVQMRLNGLRVSVDQYLTDSITSVLSRCEQGRARCELAGPPKVSRAAAEDKYGGREQEALGFNSARQNGQCASIDRY